MNKYKQELINERNEVLECAYALIDLGIGPEQSAARAAHSATSLRAGYSTAIALNLSMYAARKKSLELEYQIDRVLELL